MQECKRKKLNIRGNKKGVTLVELVIVIAILAVLGAIAGGSFASAWNARARKAIYVADSMLAQSKVDALSGRENFYVLWYDATEETYFCELYKGEFKSSDTSIPAGAICTKSETLGNKHLRMTCASSLSPTVNNFENGKLVISFDSGTGKVAVSKWLGISASSVDFPTATSGGRITISARSVSEYNITLYALTGEHEVA